MKVRILFLLVTVSCFVKGNAQDTFYVKKRIQRAPVTAATPALLDSLHKDSIVTYTVEYRQPGSNIYVVLHQKGPRLIPPWEATSQGQRVLFTEIIAVDRNGRKYRQPDCYYALGVWVPVKSN